MMNASSRPDRCFFLQLLLVSLLILPLMSRSSSYPPRRSGTVIANPDPGIGIEFTVDYVASAVSFTNGTTMGIAKVEGTPEYKELMRTWLALCEDVANGKTKTAYMMDEEGRVNREYEYKYLEWSQQHNHLRESWLYWVRKNLLWQTVPIPAPPDRWGNESEVAVLVSMAKSLLYATDQQSEHFSSSSSSYHTQSVLFKYAKVAVPSFFFTTNPRGEKHDDRHNLYDNDFFELDSLERDLYGSCHTGGCYDRDWYKTMTRKFVVAVSRATRFSSNSGPEYDYHYDHDLQEYEQFGYGFRAPANAMAMALSSADIDSCHQHGLPEGCDLSTTPPVTAIAISFTKPHLSLSAARFGGSLLQRVLPWSTFPALGASALAEFENKAAFWDDVKGEIEQFRLQTRTRDSLGDILRVMLLGDSINDDVRCSLQNRLTEICQTECWLKGTPDPLFAAAMGAATQSREENARRASEWWGEPQRYVDEL